jgi:hypothetical protein
MTSIRRAGTVSGAALSALVLAVGVGHAVAPRWSEELGLDVWNYSAAREQVQQVADRGEALVAERARLLRECDFTQHVAARLVTRRVTLRDAVDQLAPVLERRAGFETTWLRSYRSPSFRHGVARYAIIQVERALRDDPGAWAELAPRLEAEYAALE